MPADRATLDRFFVLSPGAVVTTSIDRFIELILSAFI
jgi:hypothetical protein